MVRPFFLLYNSNSATKKLVFKKVQLRNVSASSKGIILTDLSKIYFMTKEERNEETKGLTIKK